MTILSKSLVFNNEIESSILSGANISKPFFSTNEFQQKNDDLC